MEYQFKDSSAFLLLLVLLGLLFFSFKQYLFCFDFFSYSGSNGLMTEGTLRESLEVLLTLVFLSDVF